MSGNEPRAPRKPSAGTIVRAIGKDGAQLVRSPRGHRWTEAAEEIFLDALAASNNASYAAAQCGFSTAAIYALGRRDPTFAGRMAAARAQAQGRLEEGLVRAAEGFPRRQGPGPGVAAGRDDARPRCRHLQVNRPALIGEGRRPAWPARPRTLDEVRESILKKLSAIARKRGLL